MRHHGPAVRAAARSVLARAMVSLQHDGAPPELRVSLLPRALPHDGHAVVLHSPRRSRRAPGRALAAEPSLLHQPHAELRAEQLEHLRLARRRAEEGDAQREGVRARR
eukprot:CAMPEP_0205880056 /NCGR_PEP_ID=MMETSP1083-20121108/15734_1 /ASSEMBLY_ACC=CAM_ASM_000430 /TAXON_ID=97485 /ORGANISM="Prymnesium parvum, Strain Texoma1" /LENGTH=107 /DNA_ID=CAMNT_0053243071 /DNA_START=179 /DNA_END=498 /DNA_ORIENTATION=+